MRATKLCSTTSCERRNNGTACRAFWPAAVRFLGLGVAVVADELHSTHRQEPPQREERVKTLGNRRTETQPSPSSNNDNWFAPAFTLYGSPNESAKGGRIEPAVLLYIRSLIGNQTGNKNAVGEPLFFRRREPDREGSRTLNHFGAFLGCVDE